MPTRNNFSGKVFSGVISDRNTESKNLEKNQHKMRTGQRENLYKMGLTKKYINQSIKGQWSKKGKI